MGPRLTVSACSILLAFAGPGAASFAQDATVSAADVERIVRTLADDAMAGRRTPSPGLDEAAQFVAREYSARGLQPVPWLDTSGYEHRYTILDQRVDLPGSTLRLRPPGGADLHIDLGADGIYVEGVPRSVADADVLIARTDAALDPAAVDGKIVILIPAAGSNGDSARYQALEQRRPSWGAAAVIGLSAESAEAFRSQQGRPAWRGPDGRISAVSGRMEWNVDFRGTALPGQESRLTSIRPMLLLAPGALDAVLPADRKTDGTGWKADLDLAGELHPEPAPNVVAWVPAPAAAPGAGIILVTAHLDHLGSYPIDGDAIMNGADDNACGVAGLLAVAGAVAASGQRLQRPVVFAATSGEEYGNWGSSALATSLVEAGVTVAAVVNLDMIGRNQTGEIAAIESPDSGLAEVATRLAARSPALPITVAGNRWADLDLANASDHAPFGKAGIPWLFFFAGTHEDYHQVSDEADRLNFDKIANVARLAQRVVLELATNWGVEVP